MKEILTLRVELCGSDPAIWRTVEVNSQLDLDAVGTAIQIAMGWDGVHLQAFHDRSPCDGQSGQPTVTWIDAGFGKEPGERTLQQTTLGQALELCAEDLYFEYDFGDRWVHRISVLGRRATDDDEPDQKLLDGALRAPIEDSGGISGWYEKLDVISAKDTTRDYAQVLEWMHWRVGPLGNIDPAYFDFSLARRQLELHDQGYSGEAALGRWLRQIAPVDRRFFGRMIARTELTLEPTFDRPAWLDAVLRPFAVLITLCAGDGIKLTKAGWMPPKTVGVLVEASNWNGIDFESGSSKRENNMVTVSWLREIAQELGLIQKRKGTLRATPLGLALVKKPENLVAYLLEALLSGMNSKVHRDCQITQWITEEIGAERFEQRVDTINCMLEVLHYADGRTGGRLTRDSYTPTSALWHLVDTLTNFHFSLAGNPNIAVRQRAMQQLRRYILSGMPVKTI